MVKGLMERVVCINKKFKEMYLKHYLTNNFSVSKSFLLIQLYYLDGSYCGLVDPKYCISISEYRRECLNILLDD